ncbi:uncharacterized protein LOC105209382 [Zeugodacus cucurbitae]|uniref:uncharacterized protein LOC105209382 n=1 Tax=Zeugodacus cucurbitae TaxID=28588 RepID=UPI0023D90214|nr:uncharacterized protein LOC105209382 [Zeugodacus cucurbitae]
MQTIMNTMRILQILALCLAVGTTLCAPTEKLLRNTELNLIQLIEDTRYEQLNNPEQSKACFDYYMQVFDELNEEYIQSYDVCLATASDKRDQVGESTKAQRDAIDDLTLDTVTALENCMILNDSVSYFDCFAKNAKQGTENMYQISANASETLAVVTESYRVIENEENRCTNATGRVYVEKTYQATEDLQSCLRGETTVPTIPSTPSSAPPIEGSSLIVPDINWKISHSNTDKFVPEEYLVEMRRKNRT